MQHLSCVCRARATHRHCYCLQLEHLVGGRRGGGGGGTNLVSVGGTNLVGGGGTNLVGGGRTNLVGVGVGGCADATGGSVLRQSCAVQHRDTP